MLQRDFILATAREQAGLQDLGDEGFIEALDYLLECLNTEASLNEAGELIFFQQYVQMLVNRLRFQDDLKQHPEILQEELPPPLVVIGLPRSGTTKFHRVLSAHPDTQSLPLWQVMNPAPFPDATPGERDPRIAFTESALAMMAELSPDTLAGHPMAAEEAEEESQYLMEMTFDGALIPIRAHLPGFAAWRWQRSMLPCYQYLRQLLQYLQWQFRDSSNRIRPYALKNPLHMGHTDTLLEVFPGATIVHCHRDPVDSVASFARLVEVGWKMVCDRDNMAEFGEVALELLHSHMERYLVQRQKLEAHNTFIDISFRDIVDNAYAGAVLCFERHGLPYDAKVQALIQAWEAANPTPGHGQHSYSLERYALSEALIKERFSNYYDRFPAVA